MFYSELQIASDINKLIDVEHFIINLMDDFCINNDYLGIITTPLVEAVNNAIVHGNKNDKSKKVTITCQLSNKNITFSVTDEGAGFDYEKYVSENLENTSTNGLSIIKLLTNEIEFFDNGSTISYTLNIPIQIQKERDSTISTINKSKEEIKTVI
ncbi:MAG: ATP-binding protein [Bacteroidales bacterium]|nr:ATP-binding protein [Bacteroidales bacterium]MDD4210453.1 ATP-binding protein [Bacteroidales bacterium]